MDFFNRFVDGFAMIWATHPSLLLILFGMLVVFLTVLAAFLISVWRLRDQLASELREYRAGLRAHWDLWFNPASGANARTDEGLAYERLLSVLADGHEGLKQAVTDLDAARSDEERSSISHRVEYARDRVAHDSEIAADYFTGLTDERLALLASYLAEKCGVGPVGEAAMSRFLDSERQSATMTHLMKAHLARLTSFVEDYLSRYSSTYEPGDSLPSH